MDKRQVQTKMIYFTESWWFLKNQADFYRKNVETYGRTVTKKEKNDVKIRPVFFRRAGTAFPFKQQANKKQPEGKAKSPRRLF